MDFSRLGNAFHNVQESISTRASATWTHRGLFARLDMRGELHKRSVGTLFKRFRDEQGADFQAFAGCSLNRLAGSR